MFFGLLEVLAIFPEPVRVSSSPLDQREISACSSDLFAEGGLEFCVFVEHTITVSCRLHIERRFDFPFSSIDRLSYWIRLSLIWVD